LLCLVIFVPYLFPVKVRPEYAGDDSENPTKQQVYGAVLSLYVTRFIKVVNKKIGQKCSVVFDEFATVYFNDPDSLIATARSNKVSTCLGLQDFSKCPR
jgi:hypothetical protein